jgi:tetratricopeptide (TPR) repeat protein
MRSLWLWWVVLGASVTQAATLPSIHQKMEGWCSPAVGHTQGDVTIVCQGVDPKALQRLNELLDKKDLELQEKIREAEEWTRKYHELSQRLAEEGRDNELARQADALLKEGKLEDAGALLDRLIASGEAVVERVASNHFNRAQIFALQFKPLNALPHYEQAYRYRPNNPEYAHAHAVVLQKQKRHAEAEAIYQANLKTLHELAETTPSTHLPPIAMTLNNLAVLYGDTQRLKEAEAAYQEALTTYRQLAQANAPAYLADVAGTLNNLALLALTQGDTISADAWIVEALAINRPLWQNHPTAHGDGLARTLALKAMLLKQDSAEVVTACKLLHEVGTVAYSDSLKSWAQEQMKTSCGQGKPQ